MPLKEPDCLEICYEQPSFYSYEIYNETRTKNLKEFIRQVIVDRNIHTTTKICSQVRTLGLQCSADVIVSQLKSDPEYILIQDNFWESKKRLISEVSSFIMENQEEFEIKTRGLPTMEVILRPSEFVDRIPRYRLFRLRGSAFSEALCDSADAWSELIFVNGVVVNFREAFVKDLYNVLLRERGPLCSLDIALRLFDSKVGIYKKSLKDFVFGRKNQRKIFHHPLHPNEMWKLSRFIEQIIEIELKNRPHIFIRLPDGRVNARRNHIGILRIKLTDDHFLTINMNNELDICRNVETIIEANRPFLTMLIKKFRANVDEEEIQSRFYEKLWQAVVQYDDQFGFKFHTFLHRALKNILLDEKAKNKKIPPSVSLNATINEKQSEELGNVFRDKIQEVFADPIGRVHESRFFEMLRSDFSDDQQKVMFLIIDGFKDREIAVSMNKTLTDVVEIKKSLSHSPKLLNWFYGRPLMAV